MKSAALRILVFLLAIAAGGAVAIATSEAGRGSGQAATHADLGITVSGDFGSPVSITVSDGSQNGGSENIAAATHVDIAGDGREITSDGQVLFRATSFDFATGSWTEVPNSGALIGTSATQDSLGALYEDVVGEKEGTRLVVVEPGELPAEAEIVVIDILPTVSQGEPVADATGKGWLTVSEDEMGRPTATGNSTSKESTETIVLKTGDGLQIGPTDVVLANYRTFSTTGKITEDSWTEAAVPHIDLAEVYGGLQTGLTDQRVGSRVAIYVTAADAQGSEPVRIVVDILAVAERTAQD